MRLSPYVKVCCISSIAEAETAVRYGASALGLVSRMPSGPGVIDEDDIRRIAEKVPPPVATFLLTARQEADGIAEQHARCRTSTLQLVDFVAPEELQKLRVLLPGVKLVQVIHVQGEASIAEAAAVAPLVDALLFDSGKPHLPVKEFGGTGRVHDWSISRRIRDAVSLPVFLAGGLNAANVRQAIDRVQPYGVDLCSGVRTDGVLDEAKLGQFMAAVQGAR